MRVKLLITYDGTDYCGWQIQKNGNSVQEVISKAILSVTGEKVVVTGSGRTDAGVHAIGQVAHFDTQSKIPAERFALALNTFLPESVKVLSSEKVNSTFNACRSAKIKTYRYSLYKSSIILPLKERYSARVEQNLDFEKMKSATKLFIGEHDFSSFCSSGSSAKTKVRTIYEFYAKESDDGIDFYISGNGFLYNMVRIIIGSLVALATDKISEKDIVETLNGKKRSPNIKTMSSNGLCLIDVKYE